MDFFSHHHKTLGKHIFGLKLLYEGGQHIGWGRATVRELFARLISDIFLLGYLYALFNHKHQTFHDKVTNIVVLQEKPLSRKAKTIYEIYDYWVTSHYIGNVV